MRSLIKTKCCILIVLLCASCHEGQQNSCEAEYEAHIDEIKDTVQFQDIVADYRIIPLETVAGCRIGEVSDLIVTDSLMYVISDGVYCFNKAGHQRFAINKKGHAQNEYIKISSVNIADGNIYIYDVMQGKVLIHDCVDGTFKRKIDTPYTVVKLFCNEKNTVADRSDLACTVVPNDERFFVYSTNLPENVSEAFLAEEENKVPIQGQTTSHENGFFFSNFWRCQTWKIGENGCTPYLQLVFSPDYSIEKDEMNSLVESKNLLTESLDKAEKAWGLTNVHENDCSITGDFRVGASPATFVFNKHTNTCIAYKGVTCEGPWQPRPMCFITAFQEKMYTVIPAEDVVLIRMLKGLPTLPKQDADMSNPYTVYCSVSENDNPVVVEYTLK